MILVCPACRGIALGLHNEVLTLWVFFTNHFLKILSHKIERKLKLWQLRASLDLGEHFFGQGVNSSLHSWRFNWNRRLPPTLCTYLYLELDPMILSLNWNTESVKLINGSSGVLLWSSWNWNMRDPIQLELLLILWSSWNLLWSNWNAQDLTRFCQKSSIFTE